ncbi:MAG: outer membrane lipoprotein-sorting protein, partial [Bacteroidales bacterium]|nr:outer membrane lipoprotein-sorting protein [Bacteroidales bacterium]
MKKQFFTVLVVLFTIATTSLAQNATEILQKMDDVIYAPKDQKVQLKMIITDRANKQKIRKANSLQKGNLFRLMKFTEPAAQKGIAFLSLPKNVMYVYLPAFKKERRIAGGLKKQNFAGTDFAYEDLESKPYAEKYNAKSVKIVGDTYILVVTPKDMKNSAYSKLIITLYKNNY